MSAAGDTSDAGWDRGWEEHKRRQLQRQARMSFAEKLEWLEEAEKLAHVILQARRKKTPPPARS